MVVVGAGEAAARAASALREQGFEGPVTLIGDEPHGPYERPPLSKAVMTAAETAEAPAVILDAARLAALAVTHIAGVPVVAIERAQQRVRLADGRLLPYRKLLLATGAAPRRLAVPGASAESVLYLRSFADALALRDRLRPGCRIVIVGGGFIGLELAASAVARGCKVSLVEMAPRILMRGVPAEVAARVAERHAAAGIELCCGVGIAGIERDGDGHALRLADGSLLAADAIVAGIGAVPRTELAEAAGLAIENGIRVDAHLCTDDPDIFAAGDCCSFPHPLYEGRRLRLEAWRSAQEQGALAAANMLGADREHDAVPWFWSDQHDLTLQVAGLPDAGVTLVERPLGAASLWFHLDAGGRLVGASAVGPNGLIARDIRLAEMLIARRATPDPAALADPDVKLKGLLR